jgi:hypothetical protein
MPRAVGRTPAGPRPGSPAQRGMVRWRAHWRRCGGSTVARCCRRSRGGHGEGAGQGGEDRGAPERRRAAAFVGGEGSPVVASVAEEVLQLGRGEGGEEIARNPRDWKLGGRARRGEADGGGGRPKFVRERRAPVAGDGGPGAGSGGEARALEREIGEG